MHCLACRLRVRGNTALGKHVLGQWVCVQGAAATGLPLVVSSCPALVIDDVKRG